MGLRHTKGFIELATQFDTFRMAAVCDLHEQAANHVASEIESALGHQTDAVHILRKVIQDYPNDPEAHLRLALLHRTIGDQERAQQVIREALEQGVSFSGRVQRLIRTLLSSETPNR